MIEKVEIKKIERLKEFFEAKDFKKIIEAAIHSLNWYSQKKTVQTKYAQKRNES